jgi:WD40 repeat protein
VVQTVAFSPDGQLLAAGGWEAAVPVWSVAGGAPLVTLRGHVEGVHDLVFAPDGRLLVTVGDDSTVRLWGVRPP